MQVLAVVVWVQFVASQLYDPQSIGPGSIAWDILNPLMVLGGLVTIWVGWQRKRGFRQRRRGRPDNRLFRGKRYAVRRNRRASPFSLELEWKDLFCRCHKFPLGMDCYRHRFSTPLSLRGKVSCQAGRCTGIEALRRCLSGQPSSRKRSCLLFLAKTGPGSVCVETAPVSVGSNTRGHRPHRGVATAVPRMQQLERRPYPCGTDCDPVDRRKLQTSPETIGTGLQIQPLAKAGPSSIHPPICAKIGRGDFRRTDDKDAPRYYGSADRSCPCRSGA